MSTFVSILVYLSLTTIQLKTASGSYSLIDDARAELERANRLVSRAIQSGHINLASIYEKFLKLSSNVELEGQIVIGYEEQIVYGQVSAVRELGEGAGVDISSCLGSYQEEVNNSSTLSKNQLADCILTENNQASTIYTEYKYLIDITINRITALEYQLNLCEEDNEGCITPIYEQLRWESMYRPEHIEIQVLAANNLLNVLRSTVQACSNLYVSEHISTTNTILRQITECAEALIP